MTIRTSQYQETGNTIVRLSIRDWFGILVVLLSLFGGGVKMYIDLRDAVSSNRAELNALRAEYAVQVPSPARWTVEKVNELEKLNTAQNLILQDHDKRLGSLEQKVK